MSEHHHVFLSYSRQDSHTVDRIRHTLERADIPVWLDTQKLIPGTPNWEAEITQAIDTAFALILVASPDAKLSPYVQGEVAFAEANNVPIFPVWVNGDNWSRTVPLHMIRSQHVDARRDNFKSAMISLIKQLKQYEYTTKEPDIDNLGIELPSNSISVDIFSDKTISMKLEENTHVHHIIADVGKLANLDISRYGNQWILAQVPYRSEWRRNYPVRWVALDYDGWVNILRGQSTRVKLPIKPKDTAHMGVTVGSRWQVLFTQGGASQEFAIAGLRRDIVIPGIVPVEYSITNNAIMEQYIEQVLNANNYISYLRKISKNKARILEPKQFQHKQYMQSLDLFVLDDVHNQYPQLHGKVLEFYK